MIRIARTFALFMFAGFASSGPAIAQEGAAGGSPLTACADIRKNSARLACFDAAMRGERPAEGSPGSASAEPPLSQQEQFGLENVKKSREERQASPQRLDEVEASVVAASDNGLGQWLITLDNGARWQMTEAAPGFRAPRNGDTVHIRRRALGAYVMDVGRQPSVYVIRVR